MIYWITSGLIKFSFGMLLFTGGRVEEYVKSHTLFARDLHRECISLATAEIMAGFHRLRMPLIKEPRWLLETTTRYLDDGLNNLSLSSIKDKGSQEKLQRIFSYGLAEEYEVLKRILTQVHSPVVFCHNDLQEGMCCFHNRVKTVMRAHPLILPQNSDCESKRESFLSCR